jgi:hypothetical protein
MRTQTQINFNEEGGDNINSKGVFGMNNFLIKDMNDRSFIEKLITGKKLNKIILIQKTFKKFMERIYYINSEKVNDINWDNSKSKKTMSIYNRIKQLSYEKKFNNDDGANNSCVIIKYRTKDKNKEENDEKVARDSIINIENKQILDSYEKNKIKIGKFNNKRKSKKNITKIFKTKLKENDNKFNTNIQKINFSNGSFYIGNTFENKADGLGSLTHLDGDVYCGEWKNDQANGLGKYSNTNGSSYHGNWLNNIRNGYGIEIWPKGGIYEGYFLDGYKIHIGILKLDDGSIYEGEFINNNMVGLGTFYFKDKRIYYGEWKNSKMNGFGILTWPDGKRFEGSFEDDKKHGFGIFYAGNKIYIGIWNYSKLDGDVLIIQNGGISMSFWEKGKKIKSLLNNYDHPYQKIAEEILDREEFNSYFLN